MILQILQLGGSCAALQPVTARAHCCLAPALPAHPPEERDQVPVPALHCGRETVVPCGPPSQVSAGSLRGGRCCSWVSVPQKGHSAAGGPYRSRAMKGVFPVLYGMLFIFICSTTSICLFSSFGAFRKKLFHPSHNQMLPFVLFCFLILMTETVFPVDDLWCMFISLLI